MGKTVLALALLVASAGAFAQSSPAPEGNWLVRLRAVGMESANKDGTGLDLSINNKTFPEVDVSYFFTPNLAAELLLGLPQKVNVYAGPNAIGSVRALPPVVTLQYHFTNLGQIKPYVGAGLNYTRFSSVDLMHGAANVKRNSFGPVLQVGLDFPIAKNVYLNVDLKKVWIKTRVYVQGADHGPFRIDPLVVGVGVGYRF